MVCLFITDGGIIVVKNLHLLFNVGKSNKKPTILYKIRWIGLPNSSNGMNIHLLFYPICYSMAVIQIKSVYDFIKLAWSLLKRHYRIKVKPCYKAKGWKMTFWTAINGADSASPIKKPLSSCSDCILLRILFDLGCCAGEISHFRGWENGFRRVCWFWYFNRTCLIYLDEENKKITASRY